MENYNGVINKIDKEINSLVLLDHSPLERSLYEHISILNLKKNLYLYVKEERINKVIRALKYYDEHVDRLSKKYDDKCNVFFAYKCDKDKIISNNIIEICDYLMNNNGPYIWGNMDNDDKDKLRNLIINKDYGISRAFINMIGNYLTIDEVKSDLIRSKVLDKFIIKRP